jgi:hypothetical protein
MDDTMRDAVLALWHIDNHHNVYRATELLLDDHVELEAGWDYKVARAISDGWPSGAEALHYVRSSSLEPTTLEEASLVVQIYLQCNAWEEAFHIQREICNRFARQLGEGTIIVNQVRRRLINQLCRRLMSSSTHLTSTSSSILRLPVDEREQPHLMTFYVRQAFGHGRVNVTSMGVLLAHLLYHSRVVEAKCVETISHRYTRTNNENEEDAVLEEVKMMSLSKIMSRFQNLAPIASKLRQSRTMEAMTRKYQHAASDRDVLAALKDLLDPSKLMREAGMDESGMYDDKYDDESEMYDVEEDDDVMEDTKMSEAPDPSSHESVSGLSSGWNGGLNSGLGTPKKSLLSVASSMGADLFRKEYSPSMLSPVVQGMSPFASTSELQVKALWKRATRQDGRISNSPSRRGRTAVLTTRKGSQLKSEREMDGGGLFQLKNF